MNGEARHRHKRDNHPINHNHYEALKEGCSGNMGEGGTRDISRNETDSAICQIKMFVQTHKNMNAIVMEAPCRYDLDPTSRVNNEVKTFNRKLRKHMKIYSNASVIGIDSNREFYTKHGLHMNQKGKEQTAKKIGLEIKFRLKEKEGTPSHID